MKKIILTVLIGLLCTTGVSAGTITFNPLEVYSLYQTGISYGHTCSEHTTTGLTAKLNTNGNVVDKVKMWTVFSQGEQNKTDPITVTEGGSIVSASNLYGVDGYNAGIDFYWKHAGGTVNSSYNVYGYANYH